MTTGRSVSWRMRSRTCQPSSPGRPMSSTTTSGRPSYSARRPSSPVSASVTVAPAVSTIRLTTARIVSSSSMTRTCAPSRLLIRISYRKKRRLPTFVSDAFTCQQELPKSASRLHRRTPPHMTPPLNQSGVNHPARRRSGREGPRELTTAYRRYVERVQAVKEPTLRDDLDAALVLAEDIMGHRRGAAVDASLAEAYGANIRQLAKAVRQAGRGAVAHPALLARAIVLARTLERTGAGRRAGRAQRDRELVGAGR